MLLRNRGGLVLAVTMVAFLPTAAFAQTACEPEYSAQVTCTAPGGGFITFEFSGVWPNNSVPQGGTAYVVGDRIDVILGQQQGMLPVVTPWSATVQSPRLANGEYEVWVTLPMPCIPTEQAPVLVACWTECPADWNLDGQVNSLDISAYLTDWVDSVTSGDDFAEFNGDWVVNSSDISSFITAWLAAVVSGC